MASLDSLAPARTPINEEDEDDVEMNGSANGLHRHPKTVSQTSISPPSHAATDYSAEAPRVRPLLLQESESGHRNENGDPKSQIRESQEEEEDAAVDDEDEDDEEEEEPARSSQAGPPRKQVKRTPRASALQEDPALTEPIPDDTPCGAILSVSLVDFMCHRRFTQPLGPYINFITGVNGSGKSSIVTAIQVALGSSARHTGRGTNLSSLVRHGAKGAARIRLILANKGGEAYKPELYGDRVVVERVIPNPNKSGSSSFKLLSGRSMSMMEKGASVIDKLVHHYGFYVDNPCVLLEQMAAKQFLVGSPEDKLDFFLKATDLSRLMTNYEASEAALTTSRASLEKVAKELRMLRTAVDVATHEFHRLSDMRNQSARVHEAETAYVRSLAWSTLGEEESCAAALQRAESFVAAAETKLAGFAEARRELEVEHQELMRKAKETQEASERRREELQVARTNLKEAERPIKDAEAKTQRLVARVQADEESLVAAEKGVEKKRAAVEEHQRKLDAGEGSNPASSTAANAGGAGSNHSNLLIARIHTQQIEYDRLTRELRDADFEGKLDRARLERDRVHSERTECEHLLLKKRRERDYEANELRRYEVDAAATSGRDNPLARFGPGVAELVRLLREDARYSKPPVFIGEHVKLRPGFESWAKIIERLLRTKLMTVMCHTMGDVSLVSAALQRLGLRQRVAVACSAFRTERHRVDRVPEGFHSIESALEITDVVAYNALVDSSKIEGIVLMTGTSLEIRQRVWLKDAATGKTRLPPNVVAAYGPDGTSYSVRFGAQSSEVSDLSQFHVVLLAQTSAMMQDSLAKSKEGTMKRLQQLDEELRVLERDRARFPSELSALDAETKRLEREQRDLETQREAVKTQRDALHAELNQVASQASSTQSNPQESDPREDELWKLRNDHEVAQMALEEERAALAEERDRLSKLRREKEEAESRLEPFRREIERCTRSFEESQRSAEEIQLRLEEHQSKYTPLMTAQASIEDALQEKRSQLGALTTKLTKARAEAEETKELCEEYGGMGERSDYTKPTSYYSRELETQRGVLEAEKKRLQQSGADELRLLDEAQLTMERAKRRFDATSLDMDRVSTHVRELESALKRRRKRYDSHLEHAQSITARWFRHLMQKKGQTGHVSFEKQRIDVAVSKVNVGDPSGAAAGQQQLMDTKSLSGGEKSYATVALLLAMGRNVHAPVMLMDEFDVFMDASSRGVAVQQLISAARETEGGVRKQCIFITPLDISNVPNDPDVKKWQVVPKVSEFGASGSVVNRV